jgi:5-methyltetrahydrofolate--homocysteine methyltransferase
VLIGDGAMGTMLFERGLKPGDCPEQLNLDQRQMLEEVARLYLEAGADIIETNTFGGSPLKLAQYMLSEKTEEINAAAVRAVRSAAGERAYVSASCGPSGQLLEPYGDVSPELMAENFTRQVRAIAAEGVDLFCVETMTDLTEATLAVGACKTVSPATPVCATMTFDVTPRGFFTIMGVSVEQAAHGLADAGADVIGSNCGNGIEAMIEIAREFKKHSSLPLIIQSNAGLPEMQDGQPVYRESPEFMTKKARALIDIGVRIIGGCCGTTPEHIAALRRMADQVKVS